MIRPLMEHLGLTYAEAADFLNKHLGTRYPPQNVVDFIRDRLK